MIEIRELVIRATVEDSPRRNGQAATEIARPQNDVQKGCCPDTVDLLLQIMKEKNER